MKKWLVVLMLVLLVGPVFAAQTEKVIIDGETINRASPTVEAYTNISDADKVTFFVTYTSSSTTKGITASVTARASVDGIHWQDISWYDVAGGVTPQTSEALDTNQTYIGTLPYDGTAKYLKIGLNITESGSNEIYGLTDSQTATVTVTVVEKK